MRCLVPWLWAALIGLGASCHRAEPRPAVEGPLLAALDGGLGLEVAAAPAEGLHLRLDLARVGDLAIASRTVVTQSPGAGSDPATAQGRAASRADGAVVLARDAVEEDGAVVMRIVHASLALDPDLGTSAERLAGLAAKGAVRLSKAKDGSLGAEVLTVADAVAPVVAGFATGLALATPTLPSGAAGTDDSWTDRIEIPFARGAAHLAADRSFTLQGTAPCRHLSGTCVVIAGTLRLAQSGDFAEDEDTVTRLRGSGEGTLIVWMSVDGAGVDAAELRTSMSNQIERATTGGEPTVIAQKRMDVILVTPPDLPSGGAP